MPLLPHRTILELHKAVVRLRLHRSSLLIGLPDTFAASLPNTPDFASQILSDLGEINRVDRLLDRSVPLAIWLENALGLAGDRVESAVFRKALDALAGAASPPAPDPAPRASVTLREPTIEPIVILFLAANPSDSLRLRLDEEIRQISHRLRAAGLHHRFAIQQEWAVRLTELHAALLHHRPAIVHFSGHGDTAGKLLFDGEGGSATPASPAAIADLFRILQDRIRVVLLNACFSAAQASAISAHIDCVIGMTRAVDDAAAIAFSAAFYQTLGFQRSVAEAFELGRNQIDLLSLPDSDAPALLCKPGINPKEIRFS